MRIAYAVDAHGNEVNIRKLISILSKGGVDALILGGDYCADLNLITSLGKTFIISGECDDTYLTKHTRKLGIIIDGNVITLGGVKIGGVGGLSPHQSLRSLISRGITSLDILVTHLPPKGCLDIVLGRYHSGLSEVRDYVVRCGVKYVLTGHYHGNRGVCSLSNALVINPGPLMLGYYLELDYDTNTYELKVFP